MFDNIGRKLKIVATVLVVIGMTASLVLGVIISTYTLLGLFVIAFGCLGSWLSSLGMYGLGQLIENTNKLVVLQKNLWVPKTHKKENVEYNGELTDVTIPDGVTCIGDCEFKDCCSLMSITIPDSVTSIGYFAFDNCTKLTSIKFKGKKWQWESILKYPDWDSGTGDYTVYCIDEFITKL